VYNVILCYSQPLAKSFELAEEQLLQQYDMGVFSGLPDSFLCGIFCEKCNHSGVIVLFDEGDTASTAPARCVDCGQEVLRQDAISLFADARASWETLLKEVEAWGGRSPVRMVLAVEKWISNYEGGLGGIAAKSALQLRRYRGARLHPSHILILRAYEQLADLFEAATDTFKSIGALRRVVDSALLMIPEHYISIISLRWKLLKRIESYLRSKEITQKTKQTLFKEKVELSSKLKISSSITFGVKSEAL
jgi:hypothetical protein